MIAVKGIYENGVIKLNKRVKTDKPVKVIVTFMEDEVQLEQQLNKNSSKLPETFYIPIEAVEYISYNRDEIYEDR